MKSDYLFSKLSGKECVVAVNLIDDCTFYVIRGILDYDGRGDWIKIGSIYVNINHVVYVYEISSRE